ncbi:hypothetical protein SAMN05421507_104133 [Lentzea jiangxiensis]|uniref:Uncharacterized protein n=1 Tax=Lentzea jiangxiensis TaxID=641025 RepID=A0A1H0MV43_9PSEU|nr:hypothetical protein SAMN05421507_104133 [Lentzea jiangxiensis]
MPKLGSDIRATRRTPGGRVRFLRGGAGHGWSGAAGGWAAVVAAVVGLRDGAGCSAVRFGHGQWLAAGGWRWLRLRLRRRTLTQRSPLSSGPPRPNVLSGSDSSDAKPKAGHLTADRDGEAEPAEPAEPYGSDQG